MTTERDVLRELEAALDVVPSPAFEARVRERVRTTSMGGSRWAWPAGVTVAATIVLALILVPNRQAAPTRVGPAPEAGKVVDVSQPATETKLVVGQPRARRLPSRVHTSVGTSAVVIPEGQMAAIQRLMTEVAAGRIVMASERPASEAPVHITALSAVPAIEFDTIAFTPLSADVSPDLWR
jgi:hypothetical protein